MALSSPTPSVPGFLFSFQFFKHWKGLERISNFFKNFHIMDLNELRDEAYETAKAHGWHEEEHSNEHYLALIITEIAEAVQADRKGWRANADKYIELISDREEHDSDLWFKCAFSQNIKGTVEEELADVVIRCLDIAGLRGIDLSTPVKGTCKIAMHSPSMLSIPATYLHIPMFR